MLNEENKTITNSIEQISSEIAKTIESGHKSIKDGGRIIYVGAGSSGRIGVLDASEMPPTFNVPNDWIVGIIAGGDRALRNPVEGAEDSYENAIKDLKDLNLCEKDTLIGIAASGRTGYVISSINYANEIGATSVALTTSKNTEIGKIAKIKIEAVTGPEPLTGSTRMKSGTAQKMILNTISTGVMVKLGKVYSNMMVDVSPQNEKLYERAIRIVMTVSEASYEEAKKALEETSYNVKQAIVVFYKKVNKDEAIKLLQENDDKLGGILNDKRN